MRTHRITMNAPPTLTRDYSYWPEMCEIKETTSPQLAYKIFSGLSRYAAHYKNVLVRWEVLLT